MDVALPELGAEEVAAIDASDQRVEAAGPVVGVVGRAGLMTVDLMGEGIEVQRDLLAARVQHREDQLTDDLGHAS